MTAPTLEGRLLCVSGAAYAITGDEPTLVPDPENLYIAGAGFVRPPSVVVGGPREIDACLVGEIPDGIVIAFRGTLQFNIHQFPTLLDWLNDFEDVPVSAEGFPGFVHAGFHEALQVAGPGVAAALAQQRVGPVVDKPVLVTGHSKGGAVAALAAWQLQAVQKIPVKVVTFAAPKPGDGSFRTAYNAQVDHTRFEYNNDIVPHLPPSQDGFLNILESLPGIGQRFGGLERFDYEPVGVLHYIDQTGNIQIGDDPHERAVRDLALSMEVLRLRFAQIAMDHAIGCGSGYMKAVAPAGVCPDPLP
jgi:hypothetical protein